MANRTVPRCCRTDLNILGLCICIYFLQYATASRITFEYNIISHKHSLLIQIMSKKVFVQMHELIICFLKRFIGAWGTIAFHLNRFYISRILPVCFTKTTTISETMEAIS